MGDEVGSYAVVPTALGPVVVMWTTVGIAAVVLPDRGERAPVRQLTRRWPQATEAAMLPEIARVATRMQALLAGEEADLADAPIDLAGVPDGHRPILEAVKQIPRGSTLTYGEVAGRVGQPRAAQLVGQAMAANPMPIVVPCHRVVASDGTLGGFSAPGGVHTKRRLLLLEGAPAVAPSLFDLPTDPGSGG